MAKWRLVMAMLRDGLLIANWWLTDADPGSESSLSNSSGCLQMEKENNLTLTFYVSKNNIYDL